MTIERKTYNVSEAARVLGISRPKMYDLCHSRGFPAIFLGRRIVIPAEKFHTWMDEAAEAKDTVRR